MYVLGMSGLGAGLERSRQQYIGTDSMADVDEDGGHKLNCQLTRNTGAADHHV